MSKDCPKDSAMDIAKRLEFSMDRDHNVNKSRIISYIVVTGHSHNYIEAAGLYWTLSHPHTKSYHIIRSN